MRCALRSPYLLLAVALLAALASWSCFFSTPGVGMGMDTPARWGGGGGGSGPPVFVGGPSN